MQLSAPTCRTSPLGEKQREVIHESAATAQLDVWRFAARSDPFGSRRTVKRAQNEWTVHKPALLKVSSSAARIRS